MKSITKLAGCAFVGAALSVAAPASAQLSDLDPEAVTAAARYGLPLAFEGYLTRCGATLGANGYAKSNARRLRTKFSSGADAAWPGAKILIMQVARKEAGEMSALFDVMGDNELRPFVDAMIQGLAAQEIKTEDCGMIERGLEILDPLPADNVAELFGFMAELDLDKKAD